LAANRGCPSGTLFDDATVLEQLARNRGDGRFVETTDFGNFGARNRLSIRKDAEQDPPVDEPEHVMAGGSDIGQVWFTREVMARRGGHNYRPLIRSHFSARLNPESSG